MAYTSEDPVDVVRNIIETNFSLVNWQTGVYDSVPKPAIKAIEGQNTKRVNNANNNFVGIYQINSRRGDRDKNRNFKYQEIDLSLDCHAFNRALIVKLKDEVIRSIEESRFNPDPDGQLYNLIYPFNDNDLSSQNPGLYHWNIDVRLYAISKPIVT